jgi:DNA-binding CsgD family transcriptional regulator
VNDDVIHLTLGAMPAIVRARLSAGAQAREDVAVDDGRSPPPQRRHPASAVLVTEWPHMDDIADDRAATVFLVDPGVHPPSSQLSRGGTAWLPLDADADDVVAAAHGVMRGLTVVSPAVLPGAGGRERGRRERAPAPVIPDEGEPHLTDRELDVLRALSEGLGNKQIGARLGISSSTVKYHLQSIFTKLGVRTRSEAVSYGLRHGVVPL